MRRDAAGKGQEAFEPRMFGMGIVLNLIPAVGSAQDGGYGHQKDFFQKMLTGTLHPRIAQIRKMLKGTLHLPISN